MSDKIISVTPMWSRVNGDFRLVDKFRKGEAKFESAYQVFTKPEAEFDDVIQASGIPAAGSAYSLAYPYVFADQAIPVRISPVYWIVTVNYQGEIKIGPSNQSQSPLLAPPKIDWDDVETEEEIDEDYDGNPIVTKNNEPIQGIRRLFADQTVTIRKNMLLFNPYVQALYRESVNSDLFLGWPPGTGKMQKLQGVSIKDSTVGGGGYWEVTAQVQFRFPYRTTPDKAWYKRVRHEGFYKRVDLAGPAAPGQLDYQIIRAMRNGEPTTRPVLLDAEGYQIPDVEPPNTVQAHWLEFKLYNPLPYGALGLLS